MVLRSLGYMLYSHAARVDQYGERFVRFGTCPLKVCKNSSSQIEKLAYCDGVNRQRKRERLDLEAMLDNSTCSSVLARGGERV